jgi:glycosyltransferase involved in cell wall biosynthesis
MHAWPGTLKLARMGDYPKHVKHFRRCDLLVGNVPTLAEHCRQLGWSRPVLTISNFPRPVTPEPLPRAALGTPPEAFLVAAGGRFEPVKGLDVVLRAIKVLPGAWLWLLGDGSERPALEKLARTLGVTDRVRFVGWVKEPIHYIASADAFVMPSRHETLGNALLEAWHAGVPSISTRTQGPSWFMRDGIDGIITPIDDVPAMAAALERLRGDPDLAQGFVRSARARLAELFSEEAVVDAYIRLFRGDFSAASAWEAR